MMQGAKKLLKKVKSTFFDEGPIAVAVKTKNYLIYHMTKGPKKNEMKDILVINGCALPHPERYRVDHQIEQLESNGLSADKVFYEELSLDSLKYYRGFIFFRCPITPVVEEFIDKAKYFNKRVFFDVDDLVIDTKYTNQIEFVKKMNYEDKKLYDDGVVRMGKTMEKCDYLITTTRALGRELKKYGKEVFINKNVASEDMVKLSLQAQRKVEKNSNDIVIGYLSGSITHNPDFELIQSALIKVMDEYSNVRLLVMGYLDLPEKLKKYEDRVIRKPFESWRKLPTIIAGLDINLAPIEESIFNEAKSENKWTEAALCEVVTVASDFGAFHDVIEDGKTGVLCKTENDWYKKIKTLIEDKKLRQKIAKNAYKKAIKEYVTTYSGFELAKFIESKLVRNIAFVLPSTNVSGGVNVVMRHCEILRRNGWDAMIINMDKNDDNFIDNGVTINVVSEVKHDFSARFDSIVATLYTTLEFVKSYKDVKNRLYLVQGFETDFNEHGSPIRKEANSTYNAFSDVRYVTVSKWCEKWLENSFGKDVKYAPNGIELDQFNMKKRNFDGKIKILIEGNSNDYYKNVDESFRIVEKLDSDKFEIIYMSYHGGPKKWYKVDEYYHKVPHSEISKIYEEADILLKSSILESFSYPPLEMMATGGFVVVVPNDGNAEYLKDNENCLFYEQGNIDDAVKKIEQIVSDNKLRDRLVNGAEKTVIGRDWKSIEERVVELYR